MRTLNRPMFNMGGPIKEGVMHNIREPYAHGQLVQPGPGRPGYKGIPKSKLGIAGWLGKKIPFLNQPITKFSQSTHGIIPKAWQRAKNLFGTTPGTVKHSGKIIQPPFQPSGVGKYLAGTPEWWAAKKIYEGKGLITKPIKYALKSPTLTGLTGWQVGKHLMGGKDDVVPPPGDMIGAGPLHGVKEKKVKELSDSQKNDFALKQREGRVQKYLDLMGYDRAKKTAIADALIDASKIVGERGTLDLKNITQELINPVIQATSKRLDKPEQIREAVGLMMTKAGLEKEMYDAKPGTMMKNIQDLVASGMSEQEAKDIVLKQSKGVGSDIMGFMASQKGKVKKEQLESIARLSANDHKVPFKKITDEEVALIPELEGKTALEIVSTQETDGVYMVGDIVFEIKGGKPTQLTFG